MIKRIKESYNRKQLREARREKRLILDKLGKIEMNFLNYLFEDNSLSYISCFNIGNNQFVSCVSWINKTQNLKYYEVNENYFNDTYKSKI